MGNNYRADIDGLRAVAVALVVGFHTFPFSVPGGYIGVDVFFVISGYLITGLILDLQTAGRFSIKLFYIRRARRILPALSVVIAATLIIGCLVLSPLSYKRLGLHAIASALFVPNLLYWNEAGYFDRDALTKPLLHLWSLGVEEQFYLVWPLFLFLVRRWKAQMTAMLCALSAISLIYSSVTSFQDPVAAFYSPVSRLWELGVGGVLASTRFEMRHSEIASFLGLVLIMGAAFTLTHTSIFPGLLAIIPVGGTALVIAARSWILSSRPLVAVGLISYPLYLWHWPLLTFAAALDFHTELAKGIVVAVSIILAWITTRYVEYPIRFGSLRSHGAAMSVAATFAVSVGAFILFYFNPHLWRYPANVRRVITTADYSFSVPGRSPQCWITADANFDTYEPVCRYGKILVWGDSYSALLATGLPKPYAQFSRNGCLPLLTGRADDCAKGNESVANEILKVKPKRIILFGAWLASSDNRQSDPTFNEALRYTLHKLRQDIDDVTVIGPSPTFSPNLPNAVFAFWLEHRVLPDRLTPVLPAENYRETDKVMGDIANSQHVHFISIFDALCNLDGCLTHTPASRAELLYWDSGHMTVEGATYVVNKLGLDRFDTPPAE
jgi:peptidoglycan/LPS O-acetylase OafA/YrhL